MARAKLSLELELARAISRISTNTSEPFKFLVALSGGQDSVALLHAFKCIKLKKQPTIFAAHFDHKLRKDSNLDLKFTRSLCKDLDIKFLSERAKSSPGKESTEAWARRERYAFLERARCKLKCDWIVTAHHANDQAETILMRLCEGRALRAISELDLRRHLFRPLLSLPKKSIERYLRDRKLTFIEDQTNLDIKFTRNLFRIKVLPELEEVIGRPVIESIARQAKQLEDDAACFEWLVNTHMQDISQLKFGSLAWTKILTDKLNTLPPALAWRLIEQFLLAKVGFKIGQEAALRVANFFAKSADYRAVKECQIVGNWKIQLKSKQAELLQG